ncbi:hypothetical protein TEA_027764 [Camellia sinensis var. sinensis]|uniref:Plastid lipid-associated protein/fibrillin conserved domain-containing protein n=1 Tax=Camellia sinensis var. sinensis TaxID=542762 RepID=A0A4V6RYG7_CAMSN|nr:hypothetical protein TEA_027764 [Camellia sinensis var. sinensis]
MKIANSFRAPDEGAIATRAAMREKENNDNDLRQERQHLQRSTNGLQCPMRMMRTFVGVDFFSVFQEVYLRTNDPRVSNIVRFSDAIGELKVEAAASIKDGKRILFQFDKAAFSFRFLPFRVPYPVPFRLLGDEAKGWLDTTYLSNSGNLRISRGNKSVICQGLRTTSYVAVVQGTTFVLQKKTEPRQRLLAAISTNTGVREAIDEFILLTKNVAKGEPELLEGEWQMIWSSQMETDSWLENAANGLMGVQVVKSNGKLKFLVDILLGIRFSMDGTFVKSGTNTYDVIMNDGAILAGQFGVPVEMESKFKLELLKSGTNTYDVIMNDGAILAGQFGVPVEMESKFKLELLYTDEKIRITRGYNNIIFVHVHVDGSKQK